MAVLSPAEEGSGGLEGTGSSRGESLDGAQPGSTTPPNPGARKGHRKDGGDVELWPASSLFWRYFGYWWDPDARL